MVCRDRLDKIKKEEEERQEHDAKAHHDLLLKAYAEASAARPSDAQCFDDAMKNKDVAQAQRVIQVLRAEAERRFAAAGGRDFQATVDGLVKFMKKREKTVFGKQVLWTDCCERRYNELLVSDDPQVQAKLAKAAEEKAAAMATAAKEQHRQETFEHIRRMWLESMLTKMQGHPVKFLNSSGHVRWHKSHQMLDLTLQAVRGFVSGKLTHVQRSGRSSEALPEGLAARGQSKEASRHNRPNVDECGTGRVEADLDARTSRQREVVCDLQAEGRVAAEERVCSSPFLHPQRLVVVSASGCGQHLCAAAAAFAAVGC